MSMKFGDTAEQSDAVGWPPRVGPAGLSHMFGAYNTYLCTSTILRSSSTAVEPQLF